MGRKKGTIITMFKVSAVEKVSQMLLIPSRHSRLQVSEIIMDMTLITRAFP